MTLSWPVLVGLGALSVAMGLMRPSIRTLFLLTVACALVSIALAFR
jgi:hypothetical protein